ncbi:hypothetical protein CHS0354_012045 [Potamilus streckersoni]|uniref:RNA helicase n=1 Tax=Potamilus streckersoni TaxID=2493646 RepID=A0AAE0TKJ5_9BIVA|nr:hypothetical protein CHS0354_012045 [Potamilus streckersoni]
MADKKMAACDEWTIQFYFEAFFEIIVNRVDYQHLMAFLPIEMLTGAQRKEVFNVKQRDSPSAATRRILEIIKVSEIPRKFRALVNALQRNYPTLAGALMGHPVPDDSVQQNMIKVFSSYITEKMLTIQVLPYLLRSNVIGQLEKEMVEAELRNYGNTRGAHLLLLYLPVHVENWYTEFLKALCDSNQEQLATFIDASFTEKHITRSDNGVMKTDADAQVCLSTKMDRTGTNMDTAEIFQEISKEVGIQKEKELDEKEEMSLEDQFYQPAYDSLGDLGAAAPRSIIPESNATDRNNLRTMSMLDSNNTKIFDQQAELDQIVSEHKLSRMLDGKMDISHGEDSSEDTDMSQSDNDDFLYQMPSRSTGSDSSTSSSDLDDTVYKRQTPTVTKRNTSSNNLNDVVYQRQTPAVNKSNFSDIGNSQKEFEVEIPLRRYQEELARPAIQGKNVIIVAPTGSGKTRVACRIIQEHFQQVRQKHAIGKVILLVRDVALADQHGKTLQELLINYRIQAISGDTKRNKGISLEDSVDRHDILVLTAQLLLNSLMNGEIKSITQFSLMIFDECHHCHDEHSYNKIMQYYLDIKLRSGKNVSSLPQIIGLTASVGVGKASNITKAKQHIVKLMACLDAELISTVKDNQEELQQYVATPTSDAGLVYRPQTEAEEPDTIIRVMPRANDAFRVSITKVMNTIENLMRSAEVVKMVRRPPNYVSVLNAPSDKGSEPYIQWLSNMWKDTTEVREHEVRRFIRPCYKHLKWYNDALIIYNDARVKDAVDFLEDKMDDWKKKPNMDANEKCLLTLYRAGTKPQYIQEVPNPKLNELERLILKSFKEKSVEESRCIVFVKTRALAGALVSWMKDSPELNVLSPTVFVGANAAKDQGGITRFQQGDKLAEFRRGRYKIMVATSVAEEGLDIQQCNLVLRYDHVTHEIAMVQSRGRARAMDSKYHVVAQVGKGTAEKEEMNLVREKLMQQAIIELQLDIQQSPQKFRQYLRELQEKDKLDYALQAKQKEERLIKQGEYELRCIQCNSFICMSSDIRKVQNSHNVVIDPSFRDRASFTKSTEPKFQSPEIQFIGKIACSNCNEDFGNFCIYRNLEFPVIKVCQFIVISQNGEQKKYKKWKQVPFAIPQLTNDEITNLLDKLD